MENTTNDIGVASVITSVENSHELDQSALSDWFVRLSHSGFRSDGFWSGEILPPGHQRHDDWTMILRFQSMEKAVAWQNSAARKEIIDQFSQLGGDGKARLIDQATAEAKVGSAVTAIVTNLKPGAEELYWEWEYKVQAAQATMPGFGGVYVQPPPPGKDRQWTTILRFDSAAALENWFEAPVRKKLIEETDAFVEEMRYHKLESAFPGFFPGEARSGNPTPRWKGAVMVLIGLFPMLALIKLFVAPHLTATFSPIIAMAVGTVLSVSMVSFVTLPIFVRVFDWWLSPPPQSPRQKIDLLGLGIAVGIFVAEIVVGGFLPLR